MKPALKIRDLTVSYPGTNTNAIEDVTFNLYEGKVTMLIGPNGSGKSTVIRAILGIVDYKGDIKVFNHPVQQMYKEIGYVPQRFTFDTSFPITVEEFVSLPNYDNEAVKAVLDEVEISYAAKQKLSSLSGGQLQRVLLARALINHPRLLLLDEPEAGIDQEGEEVFYHLIQRLVKDHQLSCLIVSHELDLVYRYADQVVCLNHRMVCSGTPEEVLDRETFNQLYGTKFKFYKHAH